MAIDVDVDVGRHNQITTGSKLRSLGIVPALFSLCDQLMLNCTDAGTGIQAKSTGPTCGAALIKPPWALLNGWRLLRKLLRRVLEGLLLLHLVEFLSFFSKLSPH